MYKSPPPLDYNNPTAYIPSDHRDDAISVQQQMIRDAIEDLKQPLREMMYMHHVEGMSVSKMMEFYSMTKYALEKFLGYGAEQVRNSIIKNLTKTEENFKKSSVVSLKEKRKNLLLEIRRGNKI